MTLPGILSKIGIKPKEIIDSIGNALDKNITNKEELAAAKLELEKEINRHIEETEKRGVEILQAEMANTADARNREIETTKAGSGNYIQAILAIVVVVFFFMLTGYVVVQGLGKMAAEESYIVGSLVSLTGALATAVYNYYFGSSAGSSKKDLTIKSLSK